MLTRATSPLSEETEALTHRIIGCALAVHTTLGAGYLEAVYHKAMRLELAHQGLGYESEHVVDVSYRGQPIHGHRIDLVVERRVIVEIKAVARLEAIHDSQVVSYLRATGLRVGLLINFNSSRLRGSIRRVVL